MQARVPPHSGPLLKSSDVERFFHSLDQPAAPAPAPDTATPSRATSSSLTSPASPRYDDSATSGGSSSSTEENIPPVSTILPPLTVATTAASYSLPLPHDYPHPHPHHPQHPQHPHHNQAPSLHLQENQQQNYLLESKKMYQNSLALPPAAPTYSPHDNASSAYLTSGASPVYVPSTRAMLPVQYMSSPQGVTSNATSLWPPSSDSAYASQSLHPSVSSTFPFAPPSAPGGPQLPSPTGRADSAMAGVGVGVGVGVGGFGSPLSRANGLNPYSAYVSGGELSPWNSFNNMAMQQGFRQTGPGE